MDKLGGRKIAGWLLALVCLAGVLAAEGDGADPLGQPVLVRSVICEGIETYAPVNPAMVFSISLGKVSCFTEFDPVPKETHISHKWFFRDRLTTRKKLTLKPPRWATFSSIQLRQADKGPWRVEIVDSRGRIVDVLRFSITD